jgi:hypothetical protein
MGVGNPLLPTSAAEVIVVDVAFDMLRLRSKWAGPAALRIGLERNYLQEEIRMTFIADARYLAVAARTQLTERQHNSQR